MCQRSLSLRIFFLHVESPTIIHNIAVNQNPYKGDHLQFVQSFNYLAIDVPASNGRGSVSVRFGFKAKKPNQTVYLKQKPNQTVYELSVFKPNHLRKS